MVAKTNTILEEMIASQNETLARIERVINTDQTVVKLKQLIETHRECEESTSADMKAYQDAMQVNLEGKEEPASEEMKPHRTA
jgi:soluble cytochrome b562